jgi:hypothetical protein
MEFFPIFGFQFTNNKEMGLVTAKEVAKAITLKNINGPSPVGFNEDFKKISKLNKFYDSNKHLGRH